MSLYNRLFGENPDATILLGMLGLTRHSFGRYRDCFLNQSGNAITVITRIGGGNKPDYEDVYKNMEQNKAKGQALIHSSINIRKIKEGMPDRNAAYA